MKNIKGNDLTTTQARRLWTDLQAFFLEKFEDGEESLTYTAAELQEALSERFKTEYHVADLLHLLSNGFEHTRGIFVFNKESFKPYQAERDRERSTENE
ncbi:MAG TPA: hypothetical protein VHA56_16280 [Mucilaginibacter sp.]|nr:hypothetical protein [Mucilaginibacter sp.]